MVLIQIFMPYYLPIAEGGTGGFMPFLRALALNKMQTALSRYRASVTEFLFYNFHASNIFCSMLLKIDKPSFYIMQFGF